MLKERGNFRRPLGILKQSTNSGHSRTGDHRLQPGLYFHSVPRFTLLPCYGHTVHTAEFEAICLHSTCSFLNYQLNNIQQGCFILCSQHRLQLHQHFKFNQTQDKHTFRNTALKLHAYSTGKNMQIIVAFLLNSNKILLLKSYCLYIQPSQLFLHGVNHSAALSILTFIKRRFKRSCSDDPKE